MACPSRSCACRLVRITWRKVREQWKIFGRHLGTWPCNPRAKSIPLKSYPYNHGNATLNRHPTSKEFHFRPNDRKIWHRASCQSRASKNYHHPTSARKSGIEWECAAPNRLFPQHRRDVGSHEWSDLGRDDESLHQLSRTICTERRSNFLGTRWATLRALQ